MSLHDPWTILGVEPGASEDEIRAAYREAVKRHPPDRDAAAFARINDAFAKVRDPRARARERLFGPSALSGADELRDMLRAGKRPPAGPELWLELIKGRG